MSNEASEATPAVAMDPAATAAASLTPQRASLQHLQQQLKDVAVFANAITYLLYITAPLHFAMVTIGFVHKDECPVDPRFPRYLFFGGLAGLMGFLLRMLLKLKWKSIQKTHAGIKFNPSFHPGLSMVRTVMYLFLLFMIIWNINASFYVFSVNPELQDSGSELYCHKTVFWFTYIVVIVFVTLESVAFLLWLAAIIAGICNPDFLVLYGYFPSTTEISFKSWSSKKKEGGEDLQGNSNHHSALVKSFSMNDAIMKPSHATTMRIMPEKSKESKETKPNKHKQLSKSDEPNKSNSSSPASISLSAVSVESDDDDTVDRATLSIVRFAQVVNQRRISVEMQPGMLPLQQQGNKLDITNFPSGPLVESKAIEESSA